MGKGLDGVVMRKSADLNRRIPGNFSRELTVEGILIRLDYCSFLI